MKNKILLFSIGFVVFSSFLNFLTVRLLGLPSQIQLASANLQHFFVKALFWS